MLRLSQILHTVAGALHPHPEREGAASFHDFIAAHAHDFNIGITDDVGESEAYFREKYGEGRTFYFSLEDYAEGAQVAAELYRFFTGAAPGPEAHSGEGFSSARPLVLYLHLRKAAVSTALPPIPAG